MRLEEAEVRTILRSTVGSTLHGLALEGQDDRDEMGVLVEPAATAIGLDRFEQVVHRTKPEGVRSGPGDLDLVIYGLRKYVRLALKGNPTVLLLLFAPSPTVATPLGQELQGLAPRIVSRQAGRAFLGYLTAQKERLLGERGQKRSRRPEFERAHGYDTKYAMHMLRLGVQGVELLRTGRLTLPVPEPERSEIMAVRRGERTLQHALAWVADLERELVELVDTSPLRPEPDRRHVDQWLVRSQVSFWRQNGEFWRGVLGFCPRCASADLVWDFRLLPQRDAEAFASDKTWVVCRACGWEKPDAKVTEAELDRGERLYRRWADVPAIEERLREILPADDPLHPERYQGPYGMLWSQAAMAAIRSSEIEP
ncbi:MAG: nucleotidyltransferase domain-containing protein [Thermoleophilia bacterium]|nr:nucleotidyltransferase domain-containing protein [Thermoleophilia bacterium]